MGNHHKRKSRTSDGRRIAQRLTHNVKGSGNAWPWGAGHGTFINDALFLSLRNSGRVPDLNGERPIVNRRPSGIFVEVENIRLTRIDKLKGADSDGPAAARSQFRRIHWRNAEVRRCLLLGEAAEAHEQDARKSHVPILRQQDVPTNSIDRMTKGLFESRRP